MLALVNYTSVCNVSLLWVEAASHAVWIMFEFILWLKKVRKCLPAYWGSYSTGAEHLLTLQESLLQVCKIWCWNCIIPVTTVATLGTTVSKQEVQPVKSFNYKNTNYTQVDITSV